MQSRKARASLRRARRRWRVHKKNLLGDCFMLWITKGNIFPRDEMYKKNVLQMHHGGEHRAPAS